MGFIFDYVESDERSLNEGENKGMQNIVVNIYNPLSDENWAKVVRIILSRLSSKPGIEMYSSI